MQTMTPKQSAKKYYTGVTVHLDIDSLELLSRQAAQNAMTRSAFLRSIILGWLEQHIEETHA